MKIEKIFLLLFLFLLVARPAYAYIDPGTGSMLIQILVVALATVAVFFRSIWTRLTNLFYRKKKKKEEE